MIIRIAGIKDQDQVLQLLNQLGEVMNEYVYFDPDHTRVHILGQDNYLKALRRTDQKLFVVENEGKLVAVASFFMMYDYMNGQKFAHIDDFVVDKKLRGQGIGTQLLSYIKHYAQEQDIHSIKLTSSLKLTRAHHFYEKNGGEFTQKMIKFKI